MGFNRLSSVLLCYTSVVANTRESSAHLDVNIRVQLDICPDVLLLNHNILRKRKCVSMMAGFQPLNPQPKL